MSTMSAAGLALSAALAVALAPRQDALPRLLDLAGQYIAAYEKQFSAVVSDEEYLQVVRQDWGDRRVVQQRKLQSEVALVALPDENLGWLQFRDVLLADGKPVSDRTDRLAKLFLDPPSNFLEQTRAIADASARFNIGRLVRNFNFPTLALIYLRADRQGRSVFRFRGQDTVNGVHASVVSFEETARPTSVLSGGKYDVNTSGRFWIEPETGRVVQTELSLNFATTTSTMSVMYARDTRLNLLVPVRMEERHRTPGLESIAGQATYRNFRSFNVDVTTIIK